MSQVRQLLGDARLAHARFQQAGGSIHSDGTIKTHPDDDAAALAVRAALDAREAAERLDPKHVDPAWAEDKAANRGISTVALMEFYRDYLTPATPIHAE